MSAERLAHWTPAKQTVFPMTHHKANMEQQPIVNPPNPYVGTLRVFPGTLVKVSGRARPNATRFAINFQTGPSLNPRDDLALHLSPYFTPPRVVRNSLSNGAWGLEEAWGNGTIVNPHQPFEVMILAEPDQFKIAINGAHYCEFKHRIPYQRITHLTIDGDLDIDRISISSAPTSYSSSSPSPSSYQPSAPYPTGNSGMPMPPMYPSLPSQSGPYPGASVYPPAGPMPTGASYASGYPQTGPYPQPSGGPIPTGAGYSGGPMPTGAGYQGGPMPTGAGYPTGPMPGGGGYPAGGPNPTGAGYQSGYMPQQQPSHHHQQQPGHSSSPFGSLPIGGKALGTLAGLGLGAAAGAAVLSAANPIKHMKKMMKPKIFKHKGWGKSSSSSSSNSSRSSRSSFSSNSS